MPIIRSHINNFKCQTCPTIVKQPFQGIGICITCQKGPFYIQGWKTTILTCKEPLGANPLLDPQIWAPIFSGTTINTKINCHNFVQPIQWFTK